MALDLHREKTLLHHRTMLLDGRLGHVVLFVLLFCRNWLPQNDSPGTLGEAVDKSGSVLIQICRVNQCR